MAVKTQIINVDTLEINKVFSRVSKMHKYWSRKPWYIIDQYIQRYSKKGEVVLDQFMGSGSAGLEAIINGRDFIGFDLNPFSLFLTKSTLDVAYDDALFWEEFLKLKQDISEKIMHYYTLDNERVTLYSIVGPKNTKPYNTVTTDLSFRHKEKMNVKLKQTDIEIPFDFPDSDFPKAFYKDRFSYKGIHKVSDMFTRRNLASLSIIYHYLTKSDLHYKDLFILGFTNTLLHVSKLKSENIRPLGVNNYWIPDDYIEENVWWRFEDRIKQLRLAKQSVALRVNEKVVGKYTLHNASALDMTHLAENSIDYIFTDPPYGDAIQYSELSFVWNTWLEKIYNNEQEVIINPVQKKNAQSYNVQLERFLKESHRVLKPERHFTLCFQNKNVTIWFELAKIIKKIGFELIDISVYDTLGHSFNKSWAKYSPKSDFYITFKKSKQSPAGNGTIDVTDIITKTFASFIEPDPNIAKVYDEFVINLIKASFSYTDITNVGKLNLKSVVNLLYKSKLDGNLQQRLF